MKGLLRAIHLLAPATVIVSFCAQGSSEGKQAQKTAPRFEDYPAESIYRGPVAEPQLITPETREYRTAIRYGASLGPVFAGHYAVASWGCGTSCQHHAIIDVKSGAVYMKDLGTELGAEYRIDSRLFIKNRPEETRRWCQDGSAILATSSYYAWTGTELRLIDSVNYCL